VSDYITRVQAAVERLHGGTAQYFSTVPVKEVFEGKTIWEGEVEVFALPNHPSGALECYAWAYQDDDGKTHYTAVLRLPPIGTPHDAVKAAIMAKVKDERKKA
jgi:hypothetical protein